MLGIAFYVVWIGYRVTDIILDSYKLSAITELILVFTLNKIFASLILIAYLL